MAWFYPGQDGVNEPLKIPGGLILKVGLLQDVRVRICLIWRSLSLFGLPAFQKVTVVKHTDDLLLVWMFELIPSALKGRL